MTTPHECIHEEQIQGQSRKIAGLEAENKYKKERISELKSDLKDMNEKIDNIDKNVNKLILHSETNDAQLEIRLKAIETRLDVQEKLQKENEDTSDKKFKNKVAVMGVVFAAITISINVITFLLKG